MPKEQVSKIEKIRHSLSHLMTMAVVEKYPQAGLGVGPWIENGWYQDYDLPEPLSDADLTWIQKRMRELIKEGVAFEQEVHKHKEAQELAKDDKYKLELIEELAADGEKKFSFYRSGDLMNLCAGPHVKNSSEIKADAFQLTSVAGAYWKGDEKNKMLTRIYGVGFETKKELEDYLHRAEEAKKRDHRKLGKELDLFTFSDLVGKGLPLWTHKGATVRREMESFIIEEELKRGYLHVVTPELAKTDLFKTSGHYPYYKDTMYPAMKVDEEELILRPMTCPHHFMLYADKKHSYRELPMRIAELARLFRYEKSGELTGMMRVRSFCLADAHIICRPEQAKDEIKGVIDLIEHVAQVLGLKRGQDFTYRLSLGDRNDDKKYYKNDKAWDYSENLLRETLQELNAPFVEAEDEAAFYGPKVDIQMKNVLGKEDTAFTVQYDFCLPERFSLTYVDEDGKEQQPVVVHRSSIGAIERVFGFLIEHYAGAWPTWLAPVQVQVMPVGESHQEFASGLAKELKDAGIRVEVDASNESVGKKIRNAEGQKVPYMLVVGDKEMESGSLAVRKRGEKDTKELPVDKFISNIQEEISERRA